MNRDVSSDTGNIFVMRMATDISIVEKGHLWRNHDQDGIDRREQRHKKRRLRLHHPSMR